jgi:hypothetical protein
MAKYSFRERYYHLTGVASLGELKESQMNILIENLYDEFCTGLTTLSSAREDNIMYHSVISRLRAYRVAEQEIRKLVDECSTKSLAKANVILEMKDEDLIENFNPQYNVLFKF